MGATTTTSGRSPTNFAIIPLEAFAKVRIVPLDFAIGEKEIKIYRGVVSTSVAIMVHAQAPARGLPILHCGGDWWTGSGNAALTRANAVRMHVRRLGIRTTPLAKPESLSGLFMLSSGKSAAVS